MARIGWKKKSWKRKQEALFAYITQCPQCGVEFTKENRSLDHIVPKSRGGTNEISNLQAMCKDCNIKKGSRAQSSGPVGHFKGMSRALEIYRKRSSK